MPAEDALYVERLRAAGAIVIGKTNTPEFAAGSQTFNPVFGVTRNPYATDCTCGGSSGGAAVAVACGMLPLADGTDVGGSLRNPASWCNVVGFRTSPGRVPMWPRAVLFDPLDVAGPIARHAADAALLLSVMAGPDRRVPHASETPGARFRAPLERDFEGARVAWSPTLGGCPVEPAVLEVCGVAAARFTELGCAVEEAEPDLRDADGIFRTLRAFAFARTHERHLREHREELKDTVVWNTEQGLALSGMDVAHAEMRQAALFDRVVDFFGRFDYLVCPTTQVTPFSVDTDWVREIDGVRPRDLHRLDGGLLPDHGDRLPGRLGAGRLHPGRAPGRHPDRRPAEVRLRGAPTRPRLRGPDRLRGPPPAAVSRQDAARNGRPGHCSFSLLGRLESLGFTIFHEMSTRWSLVVADETDRSLRSYLARTGGRKGDLSRFVDRAVRQAIFWETLESVWERNKHLSAEEVLALADDAVAQARTDRA